MGEQKHPGVDGCAVSGGNDPASGGTLRAMAGGATSVSDGLRADVLIDDGWRFHRGDISDAQDARFDDSAWTPVSLPHTYNALDGQAGPATPYYRGPAWYRTALAIPSDAAGRRVYLQFDGANILTDVFVDGAFAGSHAGGYAAFRFDVTDLVRPGQTSVVAVRVDNSAGADENHELIPDSPTVNVAPLSADYTFHGGLYRNVHLLTTGPLAINPLDYGSSGVYVQQSNVSGASADLAITVKLVNHSGAPKTAALRVNVLDADLDGMLTLGGSTELAAGEHGEAVLRGTLPTPRLWDGLRDPYLHCVEVTLHDGAELVDRVQVPLGLRSFHLDPAEGFFLNGRRLDLHGVGMHQDHKDKGWAISQTDTEISLAIVMDLGCTALRLAHYQHAAHTYDVTDELGLVVWAEAPVINRINDTPQFAASAEQQLIELIRQNYNHPSIVFWSVGNEVLLRPGPDPNGLIEHLSEVAAREDPTRLVAYAGNAGKEESAVNWHGAAHGFNEYHGWYAGNVADIAAWADALHAEHPKEPIAVTEYGAGASIHQHTADPEAADTGADHTPLVHTEEYQAYFHERYWAALKVRPYLWGKFIWNAFDFASGGRSEGDTPGINDKGLVSFDRQIRKDAFHFYQASWSARPMAHIASRRFAALPAQSTRIKVYSNLASVELSLNGVSLGKKSSGDHVFVWDDVPWARGENVVMATDATGATSVRDEVIWTR